MLRVTVRAARSRLKWRPLEGKDLVFKLADRSRLLVAEALGGLLETANHRRRPADQDLDVVGGLGQPFLQVCVSHFNIG